MNGLNYVSDEAGNIKAVLIDLIRIKESGIASDQVLEALGNLQLLIDQAVVPAKSGSNWDQAKEKLKNLKV
jgi:hypothetical protein